eukprot:m.277804 g.277804  ORF g.277804 m.277804 type:complete len:384 (+) comp54880_c0_seq1:1785-2936(+)
MADTVFDVAVVGAGVVGSATAYALIKRNLKVLLIEQYERLHTKGSSHGGSRITRRTYEQLHFTKMMTEAYELWDSIEREHGSPFFIPTGGLNVGKRENPRIQGIIKFAREVGAPIELIDSAEILKRYGLKYSNDYIGIVDKDAGVLEANKAVAALQSVFERRGGVIRDQCKVQEVVPGDIVTLKTPKQNYRAKTVVLTPGSWASPLFASLGVKDLDLRVDETTVCYWSTSNPAYSADKKFPILLDYDFNPFIFVLPVHERPGMIKICGYCWPVAGGHARTYQKNTAAVALLSQYTRTHFPGVDATAPSHTESCCYTNTTTEDFIIDHHPKFPNIILGSACSGHGFKLAPVSGELLADLATQRTPKHDLAPFRLHNFLKPVSHL